MKEEELESLRKRNLHLNCTEILLANNEDKTQTCSGPGYIRQNESYGFDITLFSEDSLSFRDGLPLTLRHGIEPGTVIPKEHYWSMKATDLKGRVWSGERIISPPKDGVLNGSGSVLLSSCNNLEMTREHPERGQLGIQMRTFSKFQFPRNHTSTTKVTSGDEILREQSIRNIAKFESNGFEFRITEESDSIVIRALGNVSDLHPFFDSRVTEALEFCLGRAIRWSVIETFENTVTTTRLSSPEDVADMINAQPPVTIIDGGLSEPVWKLFDLYLTCVLNDSKTQFHALSGQVFSVTKSNEGSIDIQALSLAVAVENLLSNFFEESGSADQQIISSVDGLLEYVKRWPGDEIVKKRAIGSLGQIKMMRPRDRLKMMVAAKKVGEPNVDAWTVLRNSVAHGSWTPTEDLQTSLNQIGQVRVLFYQLIFQVIGYTGLQTDWGMQGWPLIDYLPRIDSHH